MSILFCYYLFFLSTISSYNYDEGVVKLPVSVSFRINKASYTGSSFVSFSQHTPGKWCAFREVGNTAHGQEIFISLSLTAAA